MRQQVASRGGFLKVGEVGTAGAVLAAALMFQANAVHLVAERQQEVVVIVVVRAKIAVGLLHQIAMRLQVFRFDRQVFRPVRHHVQMHRHGAVRIQVQAAEIAAGVKRGIQQHIQRHGLEYDMRTACVFVFQRRTVLPTGRQCQRRVHQNITGVISRRIQDFGPPLYVQHIGRGDDAAFLVFHRRQELKLHLHRRGAGRHGDMKRVHIHRIALPWHVLAASFYHQAGKRGQGSGGTMIARQPFRKQQRQSLARGDGDGFRYAKYMPVQVGSVHSQFDAAGKGPILRCHDRRRLRHGCWIGIGMCHGQQRR